MSAAAATPPIFAWRDEADLSWFFCVGVSRFERSTFGDQIEKLSHFSRDEHGSRIPHPADKANEVWDHRQRRCRRTARALTQTLADELRALIKPPEDPGLTARPTASANDHGERGYVPDHAALMRFAAVSRRLSRLTRSNRRALELYYGLEGTRWDRVAMGQIMILFAQTPSGKRLLDLYGQERDGSPVERIAAIWADHTSKKSPQCSGLLRNAEAQSYELLSAAKAAYGGTAT